jgi:hypothetical protein
MADAVKKIDPKERAKQQETYEQHIRSAALQVEQRRKLWKALADYIHGQGAFLVSSESEKRLRVECLRGSALPAKLTELGYSPRYLSIGTRIQLGKFVPVDVIEVSLPGK